MKKFYSFVLLALLAVVTMAQEVPSSFPRKFLIEHFTGTWCAYCPNGMFAIDYTIQESDVPYIWVSHHIDDTYSTEEGYDIFNIYASSVPANQVGVPAMMLNRTPQSQGLGFHPGYLPEMTITDKTTAEASVVIDHTFDTETRQLAITISGQVANTTTTAYLLTVLIKENGVISGQSDAYYAWGSTWKEFLHPRLSRGFLTAAMGDKVVVENQSYNKTYTYTMDETWIPENCCIVAYITPETNNPIINAEQTPIVTETTGGEHYYPMGITSMNAPSAPDKITFDSIVVNKPSDNKLKALLLSKEIVSHSVYGTMQPVLVLDINTTADTLPIATLDILHGDQLNSITAGYFELDSLSFGGSCYYYVDPIALQQGELVPFFTWRLNKGKLAVDKQGNILTAGNFYNGKHFTMRYTVPTTSVETILTDKDQDNKFFRNGQLIIRKGDMEFTILGNTL